MIELKKFAGFIKESCAGEVVHKQVQLLKQPAFSALVNEEETNLHSDFLSAHLFHLLLSIEAATSMDKDFDSLLLTEGSLKDNLPVAFTLLQSQKQALLTVLSFYTTDVNTALKVLTGLNEVYFKLETKLFQAMQIRQTIPVQLKETEEQFKDLFENAHDLIHFVEPDGKIRYVNAAWIACLQYGLDEIRGKSIYDFVHDDGRDQFINYRNAVLKNEMPDKEIMVPFQTKNGNKKILQGFVSTKFNNGQAVYTRGIFRDITGKIKTEEELRFYIAQLAEREENLKSLVTQAPDAIIVVDVLGKIMLWNPKAEEIFGWGSGEAVGKTLEETIIPKAYHKAHQAGMQAYLSTGIARILNQTIEIQAVNKQGHEFLISLTISKSVQAGETVFISFIRDISQQKKNENELVRKRKELENSNRELEQYAWLTSHDLKEPLRKILTFSDLIITRYQNDIPHDVIVFLQKIQEAGVRMGNLIAAILLYSSVREEHSLFEAVDLDVVLKEVLSDLEVAIREAGAEVHAQPMPVIEGVPFQLKQLLQNIIGNAIKYRSKNRPLVITISSETKNIDRIKLRIQDNGTGFSMQNEKKIFGLFQRLNTDKSIKGTGVGLALCKKIVLNHDGEISVESEPEKGTSFFITLPIRQSRY